jgi:hypothetical protein
MQTTTIKKLDNGYLINSEWEINDDNGKRIRENEFFVVEEVYDKELEEEYKTLDIEKIAFCKMVEKIAGTFGFSYDKFGAENLNISFNKPGHKL